MVGILQPPSRTIAISVLRSLVIGTRAGASSAPPLPFPSGAWHSAHTRSYAVLPDAFDCPAALGCAASANHSAPDNTTAPPTYPAFMQPPGTAWWHKRRGVAKPIVCPSPFLLRHPDTFLSLRL